MTDGLFSLQSPLSTCDKTVIHVIYLFIYLCENTVQVTRIASVDQPLLHQMNINDLNTF